MKSATLSVVCAAAMGSATAWADPFMTCQDATNYGYNNAQFYVSAVYNRANCNRSDATLYERYVFDIVPTYWAQNAKDTTPEKSACLMRGSYAGWLDTIRVSYEKCASVVGFDVIERALLGRVAGSLFSAFFPKGSGYYTPEIVSQAYEYDLVGWGLVGTPVDCSSEIDRNVVGVPPNLVEALKLTVCK